MLTHFFSFEVRYWLRSWMLWIFFLIIALLIFGATATDHVQIGGALENTYRNAPFVIENYYSITSLLTLLMTVAFVNSAASRDFAFNTSQLLFVTPIKKFDYLTGRYLGSALIAVIPMLGVSIGILVGKWMPWVDPERWGPVNWSAHLYGILLFAIPNTLFIASVIFTIAVLTRSTVTSFLGGLLLLTGYGIGAALSTDVQHETWAALLDPFGVRTFTLATKYLTVSEKNSLAIGYGGLLLWNRVIWLAVGVAIFAFAYSRFRFEERAGRKRKVSDEVEPTLIEAVAITLPALRRSFGFGAQCAQFWGSFKVEVFGMVKSTSFIVITCAALLNSIPSLVLNASEGYGNTSLPVTYRIIEIIQGSLYTFLLAMVTYYAGVLVWKERDARMDEIEDAMPHSDWPAYASKLFALLCIIFLIVCLAMASGVLTQVFSGYHRYQFGLWVTELLFMDFTTFVFFAILAYFVHVISPNKYVGYFGFIAFAIANLFAWRPLNVATRLVQFGSQPDTTYSDFFGFAPYWTSWTWFTTYWLAFCGLLAVASILLWQRGREQGWRMRWRAARLRFTAPWRALTFGLLAVFLGTGAWIYYNTEVLNTILSEDDRDRMSADYEKTYKKYEGVPQPRFIDVKYKIDLFPERRAATMHADTIIQNKTSQPVSVLHVNYPGPDFQSQIQIDGAKIKQDDHRLQYRIYTLDPPMQPGDKRHFRFTTSREPRGFENTVSLLQIAQNGTFFNNADISPQIGYQPGRELANKNRRKKFGLKEKDLMPALERNCTADCMDNYLSNNSDWVNVETEISTSPGQIAVAPGSLECEWTEGGRRHYKYKLDHFALNFYSFLSADYQVARTEWSGIKIEVYYLKEQPWNVPKMLRSVEKSFEYYTKKFGPYPQKEARIMEFPRIASFAQAFPGTMPYSESIGFIANLKNPDDIDMVYYVVAHEMAHQWWAHQVVGANMQGATVLSETLAQYSALMVMEKEYGRDTMRKFLKYEMDNYLRNRGRELLKERPLLNVDADQGYVHYRKGSVVMYYLKEMIGEEAVNRALRKVLQQYAYAQPPYPTSYVLVDALRAETPPQYQYLIQDLFDDITLFSNRTLSATAAKRADGKFDITIHVDAKKFKADEKGLEREVPVNDWIEIGAFAKPAKGKKFGKTLYRDRVLMKSGPGTYTFTVDEAPDKAGIDPFLLLVDRIPDDNTKTVEIGG